MILLLHPRSTKPKNRRFPLAPLSLAAMLEGKEEYAIIDGNADPQPGQTLDRLMRDKAAELLAVSVMPGPQMAAAIPLCREFRARYPRVPIVWGGYFPSLYTDAAGSTRPTSISPCAAGGRSFLEVARGIAHPSPVPGHPRPFFQR